MNVTKTAAEYAAAIVELVDEDIAEGVVPAGVCSFVELHDHVDANEYTIDAGLFPESDDDFEFIATVEHLVARLLAERVLVAGTPVEYEIGEDTTKGTVRELLPAVAGTVGSEAQPMRVVIERADGGVVTVFPLNVKRDSDRCPVCDSDADAADAVAVWASATSGTLIAVTCSDECADRLGEHRDGRGVLAMSAVPAARAAFLARD